MSKAVTPRRLQDNEAEARLTSIRVSPRKLNLIAGMIQGHPVDVAMKSLMVSPKRISKEVQQLLKSAVANAENNHNLDPNKLIVKAAYVGKALVIRRFHARARGRGARILKPFSQISIVVQEQE